MDVDQVKLIEVRFKRFTVVRVNILYDKVVRLGVDGRACTV
jgi:hypothetical protein